MRQEHSAEDSRAMKNFLPCVLVTGFLAASAGCVSTGRPALQRFDFSQAQMGLEFRLTLYAPNDATARAAAEAAYARIAALNGILSDYDADSELSRLSQSAGSGEWRTVSPELWRVLSAGQRLAQQSGGAFDLTVGPSVNLWRRARRQQQLPTAALLADMRERVGHEHLLLDPARRAAQLARPNMRLDAGGIAKGYALDEAMLVLREHGIRRAMIHAGGDLLFGDPPPGRDYWRAELSATDPGSRPQILHLRNCALGTSGDLVQFVELDGIRYSHIVDPRTGVGLTNRSLVHVIAPDSITADALGTAFCVLGLAGSRELASHYPQVSYQLTGSLAGRTNTWQSPGFARHLVDP
jgi:FAD:protein FMN transferase